MQNRGKSELPKVTPYFSAVYIPYCFHIKSFTSHIDNKKNKHTVKTSLSASVLF